MKTTPIISIVLSLALGAFTAIAGPVTVTNVSAHQQPGEPIVDITYDLLNPSGGVHTVLLCASTNSGATYSLPCTNISGDVGAGVTVGANKQVVWFAAGDLVAMSTAVARVQVTAMEGTNNYCIIDVAGGPNAASYPVSYQATAPPLDDTHKTTKIVLRKIPSGSFVMGSPTNELGRYTDETQHKVTLTKDFYMGIYEITQAQYTNVMGVNPAYFQQGAHAPQRPVEQVSWNTVRSGTWPGGTPAGTTFMGKLRTRTAALAFDLPTEAQWEYACRASTTKALNNNTNLQNIGQDLNMDILGRYWDNGGSTYDTEPVNGGSAASGSYLVNQWGLYDIHGNVSEWCLDWYGEYGGNATDPSGPASSPYSDRVIRGGGWDYSAFGCRSALRFDDDPDNAYSIYGFRLCLPVVQ